MTTKSKRATSYQWHQVIDLASRSKCSPSAVRNALDGRPCRRATLVLVTEAARELGLGHLIPTAAGAPHTPRTPASEAARGTDGAPHTDARDDGEGSRVASGAGTGSDTTTDGICR